MDAKLGATSGVSGRRRRVIVVRESHSVAKTSGCDESPTLGSGRVSSTDLWKTMGTAGLTCPQAATYRGSVGVEPAVSCCARWTTVLIDGFLGRLAGPVPTADLSVDLSTNVISSNRSHSSEQADVPAEQPSSAQEARLPSSDAHPCGPRDSRLPPYQGSSAPGGVSHPADTRW